jgi:hypothetical protein
MSEKKEHHILNVYLLRKGEFSFSRTVTRINSRNLEIQLDEIRVKGNDD